MAAPRVRAVTPALRPSSRISLPSEGARRLLDQAQLIEAGPEDLLGVGPQVPAQYLLVHGPEVHVVLEVAAGIEVGEAGRLAVHTAFDGVAQEQQGRRGAVV